MINLTPERITRFWSLIEKTDGCWLWRGSVDVNGYGRMAVGRTADKKPFTMKAHRLAWIINFGEIPEEMLVCHRCDVRNCVNPDHLFLGTAADNRHDQDSKMRHNHGESVNTNKLTESQVLEIRKRYDNAPVKYGLKSSLGREYGVSDALIGLIVRRKCWKHLP